MCYRMFKSNYSMIDNINGVPCHRQVGAVVGGHDLLFCLYFERINCRRYETTYRKTSKLFYYN